MVIFRHNRETLAESMLTCKEFNDFNELKKYIVDYMKPYINLTLSDIVSDGNKRLDKRIGWEDSDYLCIEKYDKIYDKDGYIKYFGKKYNCPQCIGIFATKYTKKD